MMRKRILAFVLEAALIGSLLVTAAVAEEDGAPAETCPERRERTDGK